MEVGDFLSATSSLLLPIHLLPGFELAPLMSGLLADSSIAEVKT